jgi:hypothetical protein
MTTREALWLNIDEWAKQHQIYSVVGKIVANSVNTTERTCTVEPIDGSGNVNKARLQASLNSTTGICCIPEDDSFVIVTFLNPTVGFISLFTEIKDIYIDADSITLNGGTNLGLIKISELVTKLNGLVSNVNGFITEYNAHTHVSVTSTGTPTPPIILSTITVDNFKKADFEDALIKH